MNTKNNLSKETAPHRKVLSLFGVRTKVQPMPVAEPAPEPVVPANARRILIVDDDEVIRKSTSMKLKAHGFAVSTAADGPSAIHAARSDRPDLILLDLSFPPDVSLAWDGFGILNWLRRLDVTKNIPVIIFTGNPARNLSQRAQAAGAVGFFNKPLNFAPLISLIELRLKAKASAQPAKACASAKD